MSRGRRSKRWARGASVLAAATLLVSCGGSHTAGGSTTTGVTAGAGARVEQITFDGVTRQYRVFSPGTPKTSAGFPLVVVLGGVGDDYQSMTNATEFDQEADVGNFVVVYANSDGPSWDAGFCCAGADSNSVDDVGFLNNLLTTLEHQYKINAAKVYAVGVSAGAMMAYLWGCESADRVAGVGSVDGAMILESCQPARPVSVIEVHGTADPLVPFAGGEITPAQVATQPVPSSMAIVQDWATLDACPGAASTTTQGVVTTTTWTGCQGGTGVRLVAIQGGGHTWFATGYGATDGAVDATQQIWDFLSSQG